MQSRFLWVILVIQRGLFNSVQVVRKLVQVAYNSPISCPIDFRFSGVINWPKTHRFYLVQVVIFKIVQLRTGTLKISTGGS